MPPTLDRERSGAERGEGLQPGFEDRADRFVPLQEDAADLAGAVVEVEVARQLCMLRFERHRSRVAK